MFILVFFSFIQLSSGLNNGLVLTPPMGWLAWARFRCEMNCQAWPHTCISENLFIEIAEVMVNEGYLKAGYNRINIDDCFAERNRGADGRIEPDAIRFPHGIKWLADYMHSRGLLLGIYGNYGTATCGGFPGTTFSNMSIDAQTFADWGVHMLKFDGCNNNPTTLDAAYPEMSKRLNETNHTIVFSCSWPFYIRTQARRQPDYAKVVRSCNLWRNYEDIELNWKSLLGIIDFYDKNQDELSKFHGPGHWNDPDMLIIGNPRLKFNHMKVQMAIWCIWSAPLLMSNDLRKMMPRTKELLLNSELIAINQDPMGIMGKNFLQVNNISVYKKSILPYVTNITGIKQYSFALVFFNRKKKSIGHSFSLHKLGLTWPVGYTFRDVLLSVDLGVKGCGDNLDILIGPTDVVVIVAKINHSSTKLTEKFKDNRIIELLTSRTSLICVLILLISFIHRRYVQLIFIFVGCLLLFFWKLFGV